MVKKTKQEARASEAMQPAAAMATLARTEGAASRSPAMERGPQGLVAKPQEEAAPAAQQTSGASVPDALSRPICDPIQEELDGTTKNRHAY